MRHLLAEEKTIYGTWYNSYIFLGIKLFCLSIQKAEIFSNCLIQDFVKPHKISANLDNSLLPIQKCHLNVCLNELKVCKVSRNPKSKRCSKFQLSILTNKKVVFLKKFEVYHVLWIVLISAKRWRLDVLTFLIHGFAPLLLILFVCNLILKEL